MEITQGKAKDPKRDKTVVPEKIFMADTTLQSWRLVPHRSIGLIDELFQANFKVVLTGRFNQNPIEVIKTLHMKFYFQ